MAIKTDTNSEKFHMGRGDVSAKLAKSDSEIMHEEAETIEHDLDAVTADAGAKPLFAAGEMPFHHGRGEGRGHGPETAKNS